MILLVAGLVGADLVLPEFYIRFRHDEFAAAVVSVPETAVDEDQDKVCRNSLGVLLLFGFYEFFGIAAQMIIVVDIKTIFYV